MFASPRVDTEDMLTATRWNRYGKDRLYVTLETGEIAGWLDLVTGTRHIDLADQREGIHRVIDAWLIAQTPVVAPLRDLTIG